MSRLQKTTAVVLAGGKGTRMKSELPKVAVPLDGKPLLLHVLTHLHNSGISHPVVVVGYRRDIVMDICNDIPNLSFAIQEEQLGTGHALLSAESALAGFSGTILVACGDVPLLTSRTYSQLIEYHHNGGYSATVLSCHFENPFGYGRILRNTDKTEVLGIVEEKDATPTERSVQEINTGTYCFSTDRLFDTLRSLGNTNAQKEYYLTDIIKAFREQGRKVGAFLLENPNECHGVNSPDDLQKLETLLQEGLVSIK